MKYNKLLGYERPGKIGLVESPRPAPMAHVKGNRGKGSGDMKS